MSIECCFAGILFGVTSGDIKLLKLQRVVMRQVAEFLLDLHAYSESLCFKCQNLMLESELLVIFILCFKFVLVGFC